MSGGGKNAALGHGKLGEFVKELGLIVFDDQEVVGLFVLDQVSGRLFLGIDGIGRNQGAAEVQSIQEIFQSGDFVGFGRDLDLAADDIGLGIQGAEQLDGFALDFGSGAETFSIHRQGGNAQSIQMRAQPAIDQEIQFLGIQTLEHAADGAFAGGHATPAGCAK